MFACKTVGSTKKAEIKWTLKNFNFHWSDKSHGECFVSPSFHAEGDEEVKWQIKIYPYGKDDEDDEDSDEDDEGSDEEDEEDDFTVLLVLVESPNSKPNITATYGISLYDEKEQKLMHEEKSEGSALFRRNEDEDGFCEMYPQQDILNCEELSITFTVEYASSFTTTTTSIMKSTMSQPAVADENSTMKIDFGKLYSSQEGSDVIFVIEDKEFKAHKQILAARSPVFAAMFKSDMKESLMNSAEIKGISPDIFDVLLRFVYTDQVDLAAIDVKDLLVVANRYLITSLQYRCEKLLSESLTVQSCTELLTFADLNNALRLKETSANFIRLHHAEVKPTTDWKNLKRSRPDLAVDVFDDLI